MTKRTILCGALAALGLTLYVWPALKAPVVVWSDSTVDLEWAQGGELWPAARGFHVAKPGYLLWLRLPGYLRGGEAISLRSIVVAQSVLLWLAFGLTAAIIGKRLGWMWGAAFYTLLVLFLRIRDSASAIMPEAIVAALLLPMTALVLLAPLRTRAAFLLGVGAAALFFVRPNVGAIAFIVMAIAIGLRAGTRRVVAFLGAVLVVCLPVWFLLAPREAANRGIAYPVYLESTDYFWDPAAQASPTLSSASGTQMLRMAVKNWKALLLDSGPDSRRQLVWRTFHGILGTDFYDARWSPMYARWTAASRWLAPLLVLAAVAALLAVSASGAAGVHKLTGLTLIVLLIAQDLVLGSLPRFGLPFLPTILLCGLLALASLRAASRRIAAAGLFAALVGFVAWQPQVLDWEWGYIESAGVRIVQTIPRGALPATVPATLHVRIAPLVVPTTAGLEILGPEGARLLDARVDQWGDSPLLTVPLPEALLAANRRGPIEIALVSSGNYDPVHFLVFPVIPPPWGPAARRDPGSELSPASGISSGSLDWWAHPGAR